MFNKICKSRAVNVVFAVFIAVLLAVPFTTLPAAAQPAGSTSLVNPSSVLVELGPGQSFVVEKELFVPGAPPRLDVFLLEDESGSFGDDIAFLQALAPVIFDQISALAVDSRFGVGGFRDFPWSWFGDPGDWAYRLIQDMTTDRATFVAGVNNLTAGGGADLPESQYQALYQAATGAGLDLNGNGDYNDLGEIAPGLNPGWRADAFKVIIMATDAAFHDPGDAGAVGLPAHPGPSRDAVVAALNAAGIVVIGIESDTIADLHDIAAATGGTVASVSGSGAEIAEAIMTGLGALTYDVTAQAIGSAPVVVTFEPERYEDVAGDTTLTFRETITLPEDAAPGRYDFTVVFLANGTVIAEQSVSVIAPKPEIEVNVGPAYFAGQTVQVYIVTTVGGVLVSGVTFDKVTIWYQEEDENVDIDILVGEVQEVTSGLYKFHYDLPDGAPGGGYKILVEASYFGLPGVASGIFQVITIPLPWVLPIWVWALILVGAVFILMVIAVRIAR